jgi:hypothetical protein
MPLVVVRFALSCDAEWLAGARACPNRSVIGPAGESECVRPDADAGEEVALRESAQVIGSNVEDRSIIDFTWRNQSAVDELAQP